MKKLICLMMCAALLLSGCAAEKVKKNAQNRENLSDHPLSDGKSLKMLAITSSFGLNTTEYLYDIAIAHGATDVVIGRLYVGGCTLKMHAQYAQENAFAYTYTKNSTGTWETVENTNLLYGLQDEDWDVIFVQQSAANSGMIDSYGDYLDQLITYVNENKTNPNARYIWNMTWAYQSNTTQEVFKYFGSNQIAMYQTLVYVVQQKILTREDIAAVSPTGTAIQNARTSFFGDNLTIDTYHLNDMGKVIAGYTLYGALTGKMLESIELTKYGALTLTEKDKQVILESVNAALKNPWEVTQSSIPTR